MQIPNKHFQATMGEMPTTSLVLPVILRPILSQVGVDDVWWCWKSNKDKHDNSELDGKYKLLQLLVYLI